ncbi:MAG: hypothetical protein Satyrvirus15_7 [Satyrvirus sp.]|uniref:Uncharacterized protein n=1 Tax=Satyrvirus sp. TaxID=2487771 RepID=A0A3G5AE09_9VIRU|nr:MAG: hypothetical protein Satyrvirus15_7 [Satyrvirus sp.]
METEKNNLTKILKKICDNGCSEHNGKYVQTCTECKTIRDSKILDIFFQLAFCKKSNFQHINDSKINKETKFFFDQYTLQLIIFLKHDLQSHTCKVQMKYRKMVKVLVRAGMREYSKDLLQYGSCVLHGILGVATRQEIDWYFSHGLHSCNSAYNEIGKRSDWNVKQKIDFFNVLNKKGIFPTTGNLHECLNYSDNFSDVAQYLIWFRTKGLDCPIHFMIIARNATNRFGLQTIITFFRENIKMPYNINDLLDSLGENFMKNVHHPSYVCDFVKRKLEIIRFLHEIYGEKPDKQSLVLASRFGSIEFCDALASMADEDLWDNPILVKILLDIPHKSWSHEFIGHCLSRSFKEKANILIGSSDS